MSILNDQTITSVDDGSSPSFPTKVDAPSPPTREMMQHTGAINSIDPQIYDQNIKHGSVNWSVIDERGKLLITIRCHPENMGPHTNYLQTEYHFWTGDMIVLWRIMGTAYQAGQVVAVELPPGVDPAKVANSGDYSGYNWVALDVKDPHMAKLEIRDVNQGEFHYVDKLNEFDPLNYGSTFALIVDSPLNSTTGGTQQVGIEIWTKPAPNFRFSRLRVPRLINTPSVSAPVELEYALNFNTHNYPDYLANVPWRVDKLSIQPSSIKSMNLSQIMHVNLQGEYTEGTSAAIKVETPRLQLNTFGTFDQQTSTYTAKYNTWQCGVVRFTCPFTFYIGGTFYGGTMQLKGDDVSGDVLFTAPEDTYNRHKAATYTNVHIRNATGTSAPYISSSVFTLPVEESFVLFQAQGASSVKAYQTELMSRTLRASIAKDWLPPKSCAVFMMIDSVEEIPVMEIKLWEEGFLTCRATKDTVEYRLGDLRFVFKGFVPRTQKLKVNKELALGKLSVQQKHARLISSQQPDPTYALTWQD